ncbi:MAG: SRPBCC domain-containing protein [Holophagales bacterium]|nr:SRPBCC domain-containing protein [Holophagales bacterium]
MTELRTLDQTVLEIDQEIVIAASPADVFEGMVHQLTEGHTGGPDAPSLPLELERRPGGRWFRNLGNDSGHLWGLVQSYRPPTLLEIFGPMFMSYPVSGHMIIRFESEGEKTRLSFRYSAFGLLHEDHRAGLRSGFDSMLAAVESRLSA